MKSSDCCIVITTTDSKEKAEKLASQIVNSKLGACVQITPITSFYFWEGKVNNDCEYKLEIKTKPAYYNKLEEFILSNHSYQTPEIIQIPINKGNIGYLRWIDSVLKE